ncbi:MAG: histidinol dehydrogenase [Draconibacterium sp.]
MKTYINPKKIDWPEILKRPVFDVSALFAIVQPVLNEIKLNGDAALKKYTLKFDGVDLQNFKVSEAEFAEAEQLVDAELKDAIALAAENILKFHASQLSVLKKTETMPGVTCWQKSVPIEKVGLYIPGGTAPLFSTVLMLAIPAQIAGCREIVLCSPPDKQGKINPAILYAAKISGVANVFKLGGVQAIGAMAYGTETVPKTSKIFGPGNQYVVAAKQLVSIADVAIDMPAGPSEVLVLADESSNPAFVASDLLSQAEHGADSQVVLVAGSEKVIESVLGEIKIQLEKLPRKQTAAKALENSVSIVLESMEDQVDLINEYAPEHLILNTANFEAVAEKVVNAGSVFLGAYTPESAGDYASGTNHTLPTNGWARSFSGVNLDSFMKKITFQQISFEGLKNIGPAIEKMATAELLDAHKNAVSIRLKN